MPKISNQNSKIQANLKHVQDTLNALEEKYGRPKNSVRLLAVSKTKPSEDILAAAQCGQIDFGENYLQEALEKIEKLKIKELKTSKVLSSNLHWHFIGPMQKNKTRLIAENFDWVHSLDRLVIAQRLNDQRPSSLPPIQACIQVNVDHEATKAGVEIKAVQSLAEALSKLQQINLRGLMAIPQANNDTQQQRNSFAKLRQQLEHLNQLGFDLDTLSMGMSGDLEAAVAEGSTMVRVGTAIFGKRPKVS
jgi:pyridoxal phosphate enzyme (YggS family)